jgi:hypothetical protein
MSPYIIVALGPCRDAGCPPWAAAYFEKFCHRFPNILGVSGLNYELIWRGCPA